MQQDDLRIIGAEWATTTGPPAGAWNRPPCPICGHPTGDCTVDQPANAGILQTTAPTPPQEATP